MTTLDEAAKPVAWVDDVILGLVPDFERARREDLVRLEACLLAGDFEAIHEIGHRFKGSGGTYGFWPITELGKLLMAAADAHDVDGISRLRADAQRYLDSVEIRPESTRT